jgi:hypothetical protein
MNPENKTLHKGTLKIATTDLVLMALFASLGLATKNVVHPLLASIYDVASDGLRFSSKTWRSNYGFVDAGFHQLDNAVWQLWAFVFCDLFSSWFGN